MIIENTHHRSPPGTVIRWIEFNFQNHSYYNQYNSHRMNLIKLEVN